MPLQYQPFCVYTEKYVAVYWDLVAENKAFVESFDPTHYTTLAEHHHNQIQADSVGKELHAAQLKLLYSQALETLFAFLFASLQAPFAVMPWLQLYRTDTLDRLIQTVTESSAFNYFKVKLSAISWAGISKFLLPMDFPQEEEEAIVHRTAALLSSLSADHISPIYRNEQNAIKHGYRARLGGFRLAIGNEGDMRVLGSSPHGSTFIRIDDDRKTTKLSGAKVVILRRTNVNWDTEYFRKRIELIAHLLRNASNVMKAFYGTPNTSLQYWICESDQEMREYLLHRSGVRYMDIDRTVDPGLLNETSIDVDHDSYYAEKVEFV